jgi:hypothetical protein
MPLGDFREVFLPYCLDRQPDGRYAVLNREYKPVGFLTREHVTYDDFPVLVRLIGLTARKAALLSWEGKPDLDRIFLYGSSPTRTKVAWAEYLERLTVLSKLKTDAALKPLRRVPRQTR